MQNILIISNNINNSTKLLNYISENSYQIRVHSISCNLTDGIRILNTGVIDVVIINLDINTNHIINQLYTISEEYFQRYKKSVLIVSDNISQNNDSFVYEYISPNENMQYIFTKINEILKNKTSNLNNSILLNKINKELEYLGYNLSYNGTKYLSESIALIYNNYGNSENLNKNVYPILANKYNKTISNIKCNITIATNSMYYNCDENRLINYFNFYTADRPKPKLVIYTVLNKLHL